MEIPGQLSAEIDMKAVCVAPLLCGDRALAFVGVGEDAGVLADDLPFGGAATIRSG